MEDLARSNTVRDAEFRQALKIPLLSSSGAAAPAIGKAIDKTSDTYQAGYAAGAAECAQRMEAERAQLAAISGGFKNAIGEIDERNRGECAALIEKLFTAIAPSAARGSAIAEMQSVIQRYAVQKRQAITVKVHPDMANDPSFCATEDPDDAAKITIETDDSLSANAVDISWANGGMFYDPDAMISEVLGVFAGEKNASEE